jgi:hypothetical protein
MENKIVVLRGVAKVGKSTTIKKVFEMLKSSYTSDLSVLLEDVGYVDVKAILVIKGVKIGIESQGDPGGRLEESLKEFEEKGCAVIVCTTRTRGKTVDLINGLQSRYGVVWFQQERESDTSEWEVSNYAMAKRITEEVEKLINA